MPCLFRKSSNVFSTSPPIPPPHPLSVLRTFFTCSDCLFTKVFHSLNLANTSFLALSTHTQILCKILSMKVRKYPAIPMDGVFISSHTLECTSSKVLVARVPPSVGNGRLACLPSTHPYIRMNACRLALVPSLSRSPCLEAFSHYSRWDAPTYCAKVPKNVSSHWNAPKNSFRSHSSHWCPIGISWTPTKQQPTSRHCLPSPRIPTSWNVPSNPLKWVFSPKASWNAFSAHEARYAF